MATLTFTRRAVCPGGCHVTFDVQFNAGATRSFTIDLDDMRQPFSSFSQEQLDSAITLVLKAHIAGMTRNQAGQEFPNNTPVVITL